MFRHLSRIRHNASVSPRLKPVSPVDSVCAEAVQLARQAAEVEAPPGMVGEHLEVLSQGERLVEHRFKSLLPGYLGWYWSVTLARAPRAKVATVCEVVMMPGTGAIEIPAWVPWSDRLRPGDLVGGMVAATDADDPRLAPGWSGDSDLAGELDPGPLHPVNWEPGLNRARVPSAEGRRDAAARWYGGEHGPHSSMARAAPGKCATCGWLLLIGGPLGQMFGVCSHLLSPADGKVVSLDHGCGGHSEVQAEPTSVPRVAPVIDEIASESLDFGHS